MKARQDGAAGTELHLASGFSWQEWPGRCWWLERGAMAECLCRTARRQQRCCRVRAPLRSICLTGATGKPGKLSPVGWETRCNLWLVFTSFEKLWELWGRREETACALVFVCIVCVSVCGYVCECSAHRVQKRATAPPSAGVTGEGPQNPTQIPPQSCQTGVRISGLQQSSACS